MKTPTGKLRKTRGVPIEKGGQGNIVRNASASPHNIGLDLLRKQFHLSLDINQPPKIQLNDQYNFKLMNEYGSGSNHELILKLSPPGSSSDKSLNAQKSTTSRTSLPSSSEGDYLSSILASDLGGTAKDELPPLTVRGCTRCYMFVMVSKAVPRCPRCKNNRMLVVDKFRANRAKNLRKSRI